MDSTREARITHLMVVAGLPMPDRVEVSSSGREVAADFTIRGSVERLSGSGASDDDIVDGLARQLRRALARAGF